MFLKSIQLINFRNFENFSHSFNKNLTISYGQNAAGKTNFLEAVQFLSFSKSFRARHDNDLIFWPQTPNAAQRDFNKVIGEVKNRDGEIKIDISLKKEERALQKIIKINEAKRKVPDLVGKCVCVVFSPEDILLISGAPQLRRRFIDVTLSLQDIHYYHFLVELKKILANRNKLLFDIKTGRADEKELVFWDEKLISTGSFIIAKRKKFFDFLNEKIGEIYKTIVGDTGVTELARSDSGVTELARLKTKQASSLQSALSKTQQTAPILKPGIPPKNGNKKDGLEIRYAPDIEFENASEIETNFQKELSIKREQEITKTRTLCGPHHDDFVFYLDKRRLGCFGSRGEWRSAVLALKILELDFLEKNLGERPILLLDDIFSELDFARRNHLAGIVKKQQTIITTTELDFISKEFIDMGEIIKISR